MKGQVLYDLEAFSVGHVSNLCVACFNNGLFSGKYRKDATQRDF